MLVSTDNCVVCLLVNIKANRHKTFYFCSLLYKVCSRAWNRMMISRNQCHDGVEKYTGCVYGFKSDAAISVWHSFTSMYPRYYIKRSLANLSLVCKSEKRRKGVKSVGKCTFTEAINFHFSALTRTTVSAVKQLAETGSIQYRGERFWLAVHNYCRSIILHLLCIRFIMSTLQNLTDFNDPSTGIFG